MEYCGDFGSSMSQHPWIGQQGDIPGLATFSLARETVSELGAHQVFEERFAPGYSHQMFDRTTQVFDTMSNHTNPPPNHPSFHQFAHTSTYPPPYYHSSPYFRPYYPPHPHPNCFTQTLFPHSAPPPTTYPPYEELSMNSTAITLDQRACMSTTPTWHQQLQVQHIRVAELAPLLFDAMPTKNIQSSDIQGATVMQNFDAHDYALAMEFQKVPSVDATSNGEDSLTKSEQQLQPGTKTHSNCDMLAQVKAELETISESYTNMKQSCERISFGTEKKASAVTNILSLDTCEQDHMTAPENKTHSSKSVIATDQMQFQTSEREPVFDVYDEEIKGCSNEFVDVFAGIPEQQSYDEEQQESGQLPKCFSKASEIVVPSQQPPMSATDQMQFQASESMPNYDVYEKEDSACINIISGMRDFSLELRQHDNARACNCRVLKVSESFAATTSSSQLNIEHSRRDLRLLWDPGASLPLLSHKTQHYGQALKPATLASSRVTRFARCKCLPLRVQNNIYVFWESENGVTAYLYWNPGILKIRDTILDKCVVPHQVQFIQQTTKLSILIWEACIQYYAPNGINSALYVTCVQQLRVSNSVLVTQERRKEWDPGDTNLHVLFTNAAGATRLQCTDVFEYAMVQLAYMPQGSSINSSE